jgi:hypothetical protein
MATVIGVKYFNSFWIKKVNLLNLSGDGVANGPYARGVFPVFPGLPWDPIGYSTYPALTDLDPGDPSEVNWFVEEARIDGGFNNTIVDLGQRAFLQSELNIGQRRASSLIYSGVYNSRTGINRTNVFSVGEDISKTVDPHYGSIQRLYASDNDLTIFQENKVHRALIDKDAIYSAEGGGTVTSSNLVIGQVVPYVGDFGISRNPESFAKFGFRRYFTDRYRGTVMRLSRDGLTEISKYGMQDYFRDTSAELNDEYKNYVTERYQTETLGTTSTFTIELDPSIVPDIEMGMSIVVNGINTDLYVEQITVSLISSSPDYNEWTIYMSGSYSFPGPTPQTSDVYFIKLVKDKIVGGWDIHDRQYVLSYIETSTSTDTEDSYSTLSFDENVLGWPSFYTYQPSWLFSVKNTYYTLKDVSLWKHHAEDVINNRGVFYGNRSDSNITFVVNAFPSAKKVFQTINYEGDNGYEVDYFLSSEQRVDPDIPLTAPPQYVDKVSYQDSVNSVKSYDEGLYYDADGYPKRAGFYRKENLYVANFVTSSPIRQDQVLYQDANGTLQSVVSGVKGYFATVKISTDGSTDLGGLKELWSVGTTFVKSS